MCGISGIWNLSGKPVDRSDAKFLLQELNHRGPDNNGQMLLLDKSLCLLHNRLSILDITDSGKQPMQDPETGNIIVYNGEVFNYLEIRNELKKKGISFGMINI